MVKEASSLLSEALLCNLSVSDTRSTIAPMYWANIEELDHGNAHAVICNPAASDTAQLGGIVDVGATFDEYLQNPLEAPHALRLKAFRSQFVCFSLHVLGLFALTLFQHPPR